MLPLPALTPILELGPRQSLPSSKRGGCRGTKSGRWPEARPGAEQGSQTPVPGEESAFMLQEAGASRPRLQGRGETPEGLQL